MASPRETMQDSLALADRAFDQREWSAAAATYLHVARLGMGAIDPAVLKLRVQALRGAAASVFNDSDPAMAVTHLLVAQAQCEAMRDPFELAEVNQRLAQARFAQGDYPEARRLAQAAGAGFVRAAHRPGEARALFDLASAELRLGNYDAAVQAGDGSAQILRPRGSSIALAEAYRVAGDAFLARERYAEAASRYRSSLRVAEDIDDHGNSRAVLGGLARIGVATGDLDAASAAIRASLVHQEPPIEADSPVGASHVERVLAELSDARTGVPPVGPAPSAPEAPSPPASATQRISLNSLTLVGPRDLLQVSRSSPDVRFDLGRVRLDLRLAAASDSEGGWADVRGRHLQDLREQERVIPALVSGAHGLELFSMHRVPVQDGGRDWVFERFIGHGGPGWVLTGTVSIAASALTGRGASRETMSTSVLQRVVAALPDVQWADAIFDSAEVTAVPRSLAPGTPIDLNA